MSDARGAASWDAKRSEPASDAEAYAWECAENMRGWALRAEESNRELREQLDAARKIADAAEPGVSIPPADCTNNCGLGPCDCSGVYRVTAWAIDVPALRAALGVEGEQEKP